jgi:hypothetical protein
MMARSCLPIGLLALVAVLIASPASAMPSVLASAIAGALGLGAVGTALVGVVVNVVAAMALGAIGQRKAGSQSGSILSNVVDPQAVARLIYGRKRVGGPITYVEGVGENNRNLHLIVVLAAHEVDAIETIYLNDEAVTLDGAGVVTSGPFAGKITIGRFLGSATQTTPATLLSASKSVNSAFRGLGLAYLHVVLTYDADVFSGGVPVITAVVRGKKVYDPRNGLTQYSANAALCLRDYIVSPDGLGDPNVNDTSFAAMATICDEAITLPGGGTEARYQLNGVVDLDQEPGDVLIDMVTASAGMLSYGPGGWQLKVGHYPGLTGSLGLADLRSDIAIRPRAAIGQAFNRVQGAISDAAQAWVEVDYPLQSEPGWLAEDGGVTSELRLDLPFTTSAHAAQRLARLALTRSREQIVIEAEWGLAAFALTVGDVVPVTIDRYGWAAKPFEVVAWQFVPGVEPRVKMTLQETSATVYSTTPVTRDIAANNTTLPTWRDVAPVSIDVAAELRVVSEQVCGVMLVTVTTGAGYVDRIEGQYRKTGATAWRSLGQSSDGFFEVVQIADGFYDVRAWAVSPFGNKGAVTTVLAREVKPFAPLPADVTGFAGNVVGESLFLTWDAVPDLDLSHYKLRYSPATIGASYQNAVDLIPRVPRPATSAQVPAQTGTYFIKAVDKIGGLSSVAAAIVVVDDAGDVLPRNVIATLVAHPDFVGTKTLVSALSDEIGTYLALGTSVLFDAGSGTFDAAPGLFDGGGGNIAPIGTFDLTTVFDQGYRATMRIATVLDVGLKIYSDLFDSMPGLFDAKAGSFDGDVAAFDKCSVSAMIATTDDNPAGSPTWSAWRPFVRTTVTARACKFRLRLSSTNVMASPIVRAATIQIDMADRIESGKDISVTGSLAVTFGAAFAVAPAVSVSVTMAAGDRFALSGKTRSGFTITIFTGASVSTNPATFDFVAKGYGKEL